jgi:uncharacterized protein (DUF488 family)
VPVQQYELDVVGVGYEGQVLDEFLSSLVGLGVRTLVDVRLTPISRKRGFSKRALAAAAESVGIEYEHLRSLGNPKDNRTGFAGGPDELTEARARYRGLLDDGVAEQALDRIEQLGREGRVALLCFEADECRCHRQVLLQLLEGRRAGVTV